MKKSGLALLALVATAAAGACTADADCGRGFECSLPAPAPSCGRVIEEGGACHTAGAARENVGRHLCCAAGTSCSEGSVWGPRTCTKVEGTCVRKEVQKRYECTDKTLSDGGAWHDSRTWRSGGFTCQDYADWGACASKGHKFAFEGLAANDACCACGGGEQGARICPPRVRKAWSSLECHERTHYVDAVNAFKKNDPEQYELLVTSHVALFSYAHGTSAFLHWHRWYLVGYENALRAQPGFECVTVPYWDWEQDSGSEFMAYPLRAETFGSWDGVDAETGCVTNGIAADWEATPSASTAQTNTTCLRRHFQPPPPPFVPETHPERRFATTEQLAALIIGNPNETNPEFEVFRGPFEGRPHAWPHIVVGGWGPAFMGGPDVPAQMSSAYSPDDPLFWVHHCNVDRIFAVWQDYHGHDLVDVETEVATPHHYEAVVDDACVPMCLQGAPPCPPPCMDEMSPVFGNATVCPPWCMGPNFPCTPGCNAQPVETLDLDAPMPFGATPETTAPSLQGFVTPRMMHAPTQLGEYNSYTYVADNLAAALDAFPGWQHRNEWTFVQPRAADDEYVPVDNCGVMPPAVPPGCLPSRGEVTYATCGAVFPRPGNATAPGPAAPVAPQAPAAPMAGARAAGELSAEPLGYVEGLCARLAEQCGPDGQGLGAPAGSPAEALYQELARRMGQSAADAVNYQPCHMIQAFGCFA
eukprot:TRINITY_DN294_c1_g2_i1.p2 TRINITY_DN294_c1_g2~~TRINITY_DN294_c1_g2_i1.p2  ORF type:complete len:700 (+),score=306.90 TRINITY_DN294_c1_g2_i1:57-2156(+)